MNRRMILYSSSACAGLALIGIRLARHANAAGQPATAEHYTVVHTDAEWRQLLTRLPMRSCVRPVRSLPSHRLCCMKSGQVSSIARAAHCRFIRRRPSSIAALVGPASGTTCPAPSRLPMMTVSAWIARRCIAPDAAVISATSSPTGRSPQDFDIA
jgi:hypothetical protein